VWEQVETLWTLLRVGTEEREDGRGLSYLVLLWIMESKFGVDEDPERRKATQKANALSAGPGHL
jgi:hypothetical protein